VKLRVAKKVARRVFDDDWQPFVDREATWVKARDLLWKIRYRRNSGLSTWCERWGRWDPTRPMAPGEMPF
jgi:hypothetical protein